MVFTNAPFHLTIITFWIPLLYIMIFALGLSLMLCSANVFFRDIQHLYSVFLTAWMYLSGIFYSIDIVPDFLKPIVVFNPMFQFISFFRTIIMDGRFPNPAQNLYCIGSAALMLLLGILVFRKTQDKFILHI